MKYHGILNTCCESRIGSGYCSGMHDPIKVGGSGGGTPLKEIYTYTYI